MTRPTDSAMRIDELMAELGWIHRLSRALVRDPATAADVAQDAWLAASRNPPEDARPLRPWLSRVVRNVVRMRHRAGQRRAAREAASESAGARDVPTPAELVERVELQRAVAGELLALREPYRSTLLLHFVEGLSSGEIARRLGVPDGTIRRRVKVGVDELRERLDDRLGARGDRPGPGWLAALAPLAQLPHSRPIPASTLGVVTMKKLIAAVIVLVLLALIGVLVWRARGGSAVDGAPVDGAELRVARRGAGGRGAPGGRPAGADIPAWLTQRGAPARRIAGHVRSPDGPLEGATVRLALISAPGAAEPVAELRTGADGGFDFGPRPAATFVVGAEAPQHAASALTIAVADPTARPDQLVLRLAGCRSQLYGSVLDASGGPIAGARVTAAEVGGAASDTGGRYRLCLPDHNSWIRVEAQGYGTLAAPFRMWGALRHDFVLVPEAILAGRVLAAGAQVAGARVTARPDDLDNPELDATRWTASDADGRFQLSGLAPGRFQLRAVADGLASAAPVLAIARAAASPGEIVLELAPVSEIRGRVVQAGRPVAGARVAALRDGRFAGPGSFSQPDGSFVLTGVPRGAVGIAAPPYEVLRPASLAVDRPVLDGIVLDVAARATVRGRVTRRGAPVEGADVTALRPLQRTRTDAEGRFVLAGLPAGANRIHAVSLELRAAAEDAAITLGAGDDRAIDLELEHAGQATGVVVDAAGQPVAGAYVRLVRPGATPTTRGGESMTDDRGRWDCGGVPEGDYRPEVYPAPLPARPFAFAAEPALIHVPRDAAVAGVRLAIADERLAIRGAVVDDTGAGVPDAQVQAIGGLDYGTMMPPSTMTDASGRFEIAGLARGSYRLHAQAADGSDGELRDVAAGGAPVSLTLARAGAIDARLVGFSTTPTVELRRDAPGARSGRVAPAPDGHAALVGLPPGRYVVMAAAGRQLDTQRVDVRPGETAHVALRARGLAAIEGRITEFAGRAPVAGARCEARVATEGDPSVLPADPSLQATSDAAGRFAIAAPLGRVRVYCVPASGSSLTIAGADVDVAADTRASVELTCVRDGVGPHGEPGLGLARGVLPLTVAWVTPGGPAAAAGIAVGDHLTAVDGAPLGGMLPLGAQVLLAHVAPGTSVTLGIERGGVPRVVKLVISAGR